MKGLMLLAAGAAVVGSATLGAQNTAAKADSSCTKYSDGRLECRKVRARIFGEPGLENVVFMRADSAMSKRAALGLELRSTGTRRDTLGVFVEGVTPKGPAEAAGIIEGDRISAINGVDLRTSSADVEDAYTNGLAAHRLTREVQKLTPGGRATLRVYSGGRFRDVQVVAGKASDILGLRGAFQMRVPGPGGMEFQGPGGMDLDGPGGAMFGPELQMMRERVGPPVSAPRIYRTERGATETFWANAIRAMVGTTIQDARDALRQLAREGVV